MPFDRAQARRRAIYAAALALWAGSMSGAPAFGSCKLAKIAELPVTMSDSKPLITAKINGVDARFVADSGAFFSVLSEAAAAQYNLKLEPAPFGFFIKGVGGDVDPSIATVKVFTLAGIPIHNVEFLVGGGTLGGEENVGVLGQNFFRIGDVEYDLGNGVIRLMRAEGCPHALLAYWVKPTESYSSMDIAWPTPASPYTTGTASINGAKIRVLFDTGAGASILSLKAAERAGVKPDSQGVVTMGYTRGIGRTPVKTYIGRFSSFKIGDEEIKNTRLLFGDIGIDGADMLIGADFFLSHHIYVAGSQRKLYFTYNGGPVFNLAASAHKPAAEPAPDGAAGAAGAARAAAGAASAASAARAAAGAAGAAGATGATQPDDAPAEAASYSRRGTALAARRDYQHAIADLTRACELDPTRAEYFYERGIAYRDSRQTDLAASDFDRALALEADDLSSLAARARLRLDKGDVGGATADLDAADRAAPKEADIRLFLAHGYEIAERLPAAIAQLDLWLAAHDADARAAEALNSRCRDRALLGQELAMALADCNAALKRGTKFSPFNARVRDSRGLVHLRMGHYDKSIADYDASLQVLPKNAWSLYGRGIVELRQKKTPQGEADLAAAVKIWPKVAGEFDRRGIAP